MGASSSSCVSTSQAEESPSSVVDVDAELEAMTTMGTEGPSTSGRTEYYSARCESMMRSRGQFADDVAMEIAFLSSHCSEVSRLEVAPQSAEEEELNRENREIFKQLLEDHWHMFRFDFEAHYVLGRMIAKGGQAEIYEVVHHPDYLMKVFERGTSLRDLRQSWPLPILNDNSVLHCIHLAVLLKDGRFAFLMVRYWGDLRKLIDEAMLEKNVDGIQGPPFPYKWKDCRRWTFQPVVCMLGIAEHMEALHEKNVSHRDLKASNILLERDFGVVHNSSFGIIRGFIVADYECSIGVLGTGFWRAPEILLALGNASTITNEQWKKADVYSYGMTCFEIVTGRIPFDGELENTRAGRQLVIEGRRPKLPSDLDEVVKDLINKCWEPNPSLRPTFSEIVDMIKTISTRQCQFRLFGIREELPPQYHLATVQEVNDYPIAVMEVIPGYEMANLVDGFVTGYGCGLSTR